MPDKPTILLVDDEADILEVLKDNLEPEGYRCLLANNSNQALDVLEQESIDLMLTDIQMPGMNGFKLLEEVTFRWPDIVRMVITGHAQKDDVIDAVSMGYFHAFFEKPLDIKSILRAVGYMLRNKRAPEEEDTLSKEKSEHKIKSDKATILLVDDEPDLLEILRETLEREGYRCLLASGSRQALDVLEQEGAVDLILTDVDMPWMNGIQLLALVSVRWPTTVRMVISGQGDKDSVIESINQGHIQAYFEKPWDTAALVRAIKSSINEKLLKDEERNEADNYVKKVKAQRHQAMELFQRFTDTATDAILMIDAEGKITYWNRQAEVLFGYRGNEVLGKDMHSLLAPERFKEKYSKGMEHFRQTGQGALIGKTTEIVALNRNGIEFPIELSINSINMNNSWHAMGVLRDITERKQAEEEKEKNALIYQQTLTGTIRAIALTVEKRDPYTAGHQNRVARLASAIAEEMKLSSDQILGIELGATIHDIGKIYIPSEILNRPGKLTDAEFQIIKTHPVVGYDIVKDISFPWPVKEMIRQHHERLDGSGYPDGIKGDEITLEAQIVAVADVVEAISSHRPYRPALGIDFGLEVIQKNKGEHFNPDVVDACVKIITEDDFVFKTDA